MTIEIFGDGCSKCKALKKNVERVINDLGLHTEVNSVMDPERIANLEVRSLPQLAIDGQIAPSDLWSSVEGIKELLQTANKQD